MNKGFTLIELLAVLVILSIISLIVAVLTAPTIKNSRQELSNIQISKIEEAAKIYYLKEGLGSFDYGRDEHNTCVNLSYLLEKNYLDASEIINSVNNEEMDGSVKITYKSNQYRYEYQDSVCSDTDLGFVCKGVTKATVGTIPSVTEGYVAGDEYMCEVKDGTTYRFFVISEEKDNVNLIMDRNIYYDSTADVSYETDSTHLGLVQWEVSDSNTGCPITAMRYLYNATKDWTNVPNLIMNYKDEGNQYGSIVTTSNGITKMLDNNGNAVIVLSNPVLYQNLKARMPYLSEAANSNGSNEYLYENLAAAGENWKGEGSKPVNNIEGIYGYWTMSTYASLTSRGNIVRHSGEISSCDKNGNDCGKSNGVRPVISIPKNVILD